MVRVFYVFAITLLSLCNISAQSVRFTLLKQADTEVYFNNILEDETENNILIYSNYYGGAGVGVADFNMDGLEDLYFTGNLVSDRLFINQGNFKFKDLSKNLGPSINEGWSSGVAIADVNLDGLPDIYVTKELYDDKPELRKNKLYINKGNLKFVEESALYGVDDNERTRHASFLDYNKDGLPDLLLLNQPPNPGNYSSLKGSDLKKPQFGVKLLKNTGTKFIDVTAESGLQRPGFANSVAAADLNQDGWTDLYITNDYDAPDYFYYNNGDGTFREGLKNSMNHISYFSMGIDAGDINNDGLLDLLVLDMVAEDNYRLKANMSGMDPSAFWKVVDEGGHYQYMFNNLHLNHGNEKFSDIAQIANVPSTDWSWSNFIADLDNDGWKDIYITNGLLRDIRNSDASKEFPKYVTKLLTDYIQKNPNNPNVTIWDIMDVKKALEVIPSQKISNYTYRNLGNLTFENIGSDWGLDLPSFSNGCAYADLDNDGDLDIIVNNINDPASIFRNDSDLGNHFLRIKLSDREHKTTLGTKVSIETIQGKQFFETMNVRGMYSSSEPAVHFGLGNAKEVQTLKIEWPNGAVTLSENLDVDHVYEYEMPENSTKQEITNKPQSIFEKKNIKGLQYSHHENIFDDFEKQILLPHKMSQFGPAITTGDVNNDGLEDVFIGGSAGQPAALFFQLKDGSFKQDENDRWEKDKLYEDVDALFFDLENDGDLDLYVVSGGNVAPSNNLFYLDRLYINKGNGDFAKYNMARLTSSGSVVKGADYDGDGYTDLFVGSRHIPHDYPNPASSYLLKNKNGNLIDVTDQVIPTLNEIGLVTDAIWSDFDSDGDQDLFVTGEWMSIRLFENKNGSFEEISERKGLDERTGWNFSIQNYDLDGDGDEDYLIGNLGLNYKYKSTPELPFDVYYNDFDENGTKDIVLGYYNNGRHFPVRGRSCSSQQVPEIKEKFETYDLFASSELEDIYGTSDLKRALYLKATDFAHYILWNEKGDFRFEKLPNEMQIGSINDWVIINDGKVKPLEIIAAGGLFTSEIETPRNDATVGYFLEIENGIVDVKSPLYSGLYLHNDVKKMKPIKIGDKLYILVGNNNSDLEIYGYK